MSTAALSRSPGTAVPLVNSLDKEQKQVLYEKLGIYERAFTYGFLSVIVSVIILARWPQWYWIWYIGNGLLFIPWRWLRFAKKNKEWYLMDFCYFIFYSATIFFCAAFYRWVTGEATLAYAYNFNIIRAIFSCANGALVLSVPMLGNKIVLHDVDSTTGIFIHFTPGLLMWSLRWGGGYGTSLIAEQWGDMFRVCQDMSVAALRADADLSVSSWSHAFWYQGDCVGTTAQFAIYPALFWLAIWGIPYYLIMFVCLKNFFLARPEKEFMFRDTLKDTKVQGRFITKFPEHLQPIAFMFQHFLWVIVWGFMSIIFWNSFIMHSVFLLTIFLYALHNGSTFMFREVAAKRIQGQVIRVAEQPTPLRTSQRMGDLELQTQLEAGMS